MAASMLRHSSGTVVGSSRPLPPACLVARPCQPRGARTSSSLATRAFAPALGGAQLGSEKRGSLDPMAKEWASEEWQSGRLLTIRSPKQMEDLLEQHHDKLVVLMCKSHSCRPCKMFTRKYMSMAQRFPEVVMCEIYGDETPDTRKMMIKLQVKVTPTFHMYREKEIVNTVTGTNEKKLMRGVLSQLFPTELVAHEKEIADTLSMDEEEQPAPAEAAAAAAAPAVLHS